MARIHPALREPTFEAVVVGEPIGPLRVIADDHYAKRAMFALDEYGPWYTQGHPDTGGRIIPSPMVVRDLVALFCSVYDPSRVVGLHQREEVWYHRPIPLGTTMLYDGRYIEKYERRGKGYVRFEAEARDERDGALLVRQISTEIMRIPDDVKLGEGSAKPPREQQVEGVWPSDRAPADRARAGIEPGTPIRTVTKTIHQDQISVFSGCDSQWYNIHTDVEVALKAGFPDTLAQGAMETCWMSEMLATFFGPSWLTTGNIQNVYIKPVFRGDTITCRGVVVAAEIEGGRTRLKLEVWAENQHGVMTAAGWASALVG
jgi:acyl dehydratase